jgi:zinc finger protein
VNKVTTPIFTQTTCPLCSNSIIITWQADDIPFFGEVMYTSAQCKCGFKYADTFILTQREPARFTFKVQSIADLDVRVIRSTSGTIRIPELEINVEPGPASDSYVSNIEGVLCRIEDVLGMVSRWEDEPPETIQRAEDLLASMELIRNGKMEITLIIEDPLGNSAIVSEKACKEPLSSEEVEKLKTGIIVLEKEDLPDHF